MKKNWMLAGAFGLIAAIIYFASMASYAFPGESAELIACWRGLDSTGASKYPLMAIFAKMLGAGNLIAPICGIISVVSLYYLAASFVAWRVRGENFATQKTSAAMIAAVVSVIVFMVSPSVRSAATHLEPRMFDFMWALLSFAFISLFFRMSFGASWLAPIGAGIMIALGLMDSAIFLTLLPFYMVIIALVAIKNNRKPYVPLVLLLIVSFVTVLISLKCFDLTMSTFLKRIAADLSSYRANSGWLFIFIFTTLPFVTMLFSSNRAFSEKPGLVQWIFHCAMTFVVILSIATPLSPSSLMEPYGAYPVLTSAFAALVAGYLAAYWWVNRKSVVGIVAGAVLLFVLSVNSLWNLFSFDGDAGSFADKVAKKILDDLGDRHWLIADGSIDSHVKIMAAEQGKNVHVLSLARDLDENYLSEMTEVIKKEGVGGSKNGTLQLSLSLGVLPFVQDWFSSDPSVIKEVAIFGAPDLWYSSGLTPVPEFFFFGADETRQPDWSVWKEFDAILKAPKGWGSYREHLTTNPIDRMRYSLRRHLGFVANNRGVYLQDRKRDDEAFAMYELVLNEIDSDNICAVFNEVAMVGQKHSGAIAKQKDLDRLLRKAVEDKNRRYLLWRLGTYYGYIRTPDTFIRLGHAWARSGRPGDALSQIRRAIDFVPSDKRAILLNMMAALYANENDQRKSRSIYESVLRGNASDHDALIGLMRLELLDGNSSKALEYLQRAASVSGEGKRANIELAMVSMMKNDLTKSKELIKKVTDADPKDLQAWSLLAAVTMQQIDAIKGDSAKKKLQDELENVILPAMENQTKGQLDYYVQATKGFILLRQGEKTRRQARDAFISAAKARPDIASTQDLVLGLDISLDDKENAEVHAKDVLRRNRNAPLANYVMGSLALGRGKYTEAEAYLRKAADAPQPVPLALNDLAEVLRRLKNYPEAERYARKATESAPGLYVAWETLGSILMDSNQKLDEAEASIRKACQLSKDKSGKDVDIRMLASLARVQLKNGDRQYAKITIRKVQARIGELTDFERKEFEESIKTSR